MYMVVTECYESLKYILEILVVGDLERRLYRLLFQMQFTIDTNTADNTFCIFTLF